MNLSYTEFAGLSTEILGQGKQLRFQAQGRSMYPFIHPGDSLTVEPIETAALRVGDVIFARLNGEKLVVHRLLKRQQQADRLSLIVQGDAVIGISEMVWPSQVLGRVVSLRRDEQIIRLDCGIRRWIGVGWVRLLPLRPLLLGVARAIKRLIF